MDLLVARKTKQTLEPYHAMAYFRPEPQLEYQALGLTGFARGYFPPRAAAMGAVPGEVVLATVFSFSPRRVAKGMDGVWELVTPQQVLDARLRGVDAALRATCGDLLDGRDVEEALELARTAALACPPQGRALFAGHASLPWPEPPHLALWHAVTLLREFRGDGHVAALVAAGIGPVEALVIDIAAGNSFFDKDGMQKTRGWTDEEWDAAVDGLQARGWLDAEGALTPEGRAAKDGVEAATDAAAVAPWLAIGADGAERLRALVRPLSKAISAG